MPSLVFGSLIVASTDARLKRKEAQPDVQSSKSSVELRQPNSRDMRNPRIYPTPP